MTYKGYYRLAELDEMIPWEREIYVLKIKQLMEEEEERLNEQANG